MAVYSDITAELARELESALDNYSGGRDAAIEGVRKEMRGVAALFSSMVEEHIMSDLTASIAHHVQNCANRAIEAVLAGNEQEFLRWLSADRGYTGRSDGYNPGDRELHSVIHGRLFETGPIELRKKIVDTHAELLKDHRILDLEDQVSSLVNQLNKAESTIQDLAARLRKSADD